jgi:RimJ/RimL family protein N-acetyltransferase
MQHTFCAANRADTESWLRRYAASRAVHGFAPWTVVHRSDARVIGWGGLAVDPDLPGWGPEVTYFVHPAYAGRGYATEIVRAALAHAFGALGLPAVGAFAKPDNAASIRVLIKCGFRCVAYEPPLARNRYEARAAEQA